VIYLQSTCPYCGGNACFGETGDYFVCNRCGRAGNTFMDEKEEN